MTHHQSRITWIETMEDQPTSIEQLESACPGAPADFIVTCLKRGLSVAQSAAAWSALRSVDRSEQLEKLTNENAALREEVARLKARPDPAQIVPVAMSPLGADEEE